MIHDSCYMIDGMVLTPHAILGTAAALALRHHPVLAFFTAFLSHFASDAIPHWHYPLASLERKRNPLENRVVLGTGILRDGAVVFLDCALGSSISLALTAVLFPQYISIAIIGIMGGILPDFLQFIYYLSPQSPLKYLQRFHVWIHAEERLDNTHFFGIVFQGAFAALCIFFLTLL